MVESPLGQVSMVNPVLPPVMPGGGGTTRPGHATRSVVDPPASPEVRLALSKKQDNDLKYNCLKLENYATFLFLE